jgi:hypothetical protein
MTRRKPKAQPAKMVCVTWIDAAMSTAPHWQEGQMPTVPKGKSHLRCQTVGWLTHLGDDWCQIVATLTEGGHAHVTEIPVGMIETIETLAASGKLEA